MVKTIWTITLTIALLVGLGIFEHFFVKQQFNELESALYTLQEKVQEKTALKTDGETVRVLWNKEKEKLHMIIPHNNIAHIDNWLSEAIGLIETEHYELALSKIEVLIDICVQIPDTYGVSFENIF